MGKRRVCIGLAALAITALPSSALASPSGHVDFATANTEWTHVSFAGSVNYDVCGQRYPCRWSAVVTAQRSSRGSWCQRPVPDHTSPDVTVIAAIDWQDAEAPVSFEGENVPILPGVTDQEICIFLHDEGVLHFDPYGDLRDFPWPGPCELNAPVEVPCTAAVRIFCPANDIEPYATSNPVQAGENPVQDPPREQPSGVVSMLLDYACAFGPAPVTVAGPEAAPNAAPEESPSLHDHAHLPSAEAPVVLEPRARRPTSISASGAAIKAERALRMRYGHRYRLGTAKRLACHESGLSYRCAYRFRYGRSQRRGIVVIRTTPAGKVTTRVSQG
jgi:hypothetical protein